jgi:hypothetical protein
VIAGREPADVADVAEHRRGDDGPDAVDVGHGRGRGRDGFADTAFNLAPLLVDALQILDQVTGELDASPGDATRDGVILFVRARRRLPV